MSLGKIKSLTILILCLVKVIFSGKAKKIIKNPQKILIIQFARLGDMVCTTPMFRAIKIKYPKCEVCVMGDKINQELLEGNKDVDKYIVYNKSFFKNIKMVKAGKFDFACVTGPNFIGLAIAYLANIKSLSTPIIKGGRCLFETKSYRKLRTFCHTAEHNMLQYAPREFLRLLEPINIITDKTEKYLEFSNEAGGITEKLFEKNGIKNSDLVVGIAPSAGNKLKIWGGKNFARLADLIYKKHKTKIIIFGSSGDEKYVNEMMKSLSPKTEVINTCGQLTLDELKAVINKLNILIGPDTGLIYIAEAFGVATIDIVGPIDKNVQPPQTGRHRVVIPQQTDCYPCGFIMSTKPCGNKEKPMLCFKNTSVEMVLKEFENLIK